MATRHLLTVMCLLCVLLHGCAYDRSGSYVRKLVIEGTDGQRLSLRDAHAIANSLIANGVLDSVQTRFPQLKRYGATRFLIRAGVYNTSGDSEDETYLKLCIQCDNGLKSAEEHASDFQLALDYEESLATRMMTRWAAE